MSKNPPDWWARAFGILGILIGLGGLVSTFFNNRWQRQVYEKSLEERIFVQLGGSYKFSSLVPAKEPEKPPKVELGVEIVNLGLQPMYLKNIIAEVGDHRATFYEHDTLDTTEPMRRLEPGEAANYKIDWPGSLTEDIDKARGRGIVEV